MKCIHCNDEIICTHLDEHAKYGAPNTCCDCFDLSCGMSLAALNKERAAKGKAPITKPWPGYDALGNKL